ncbi:hypothetical protein ES708_25343 [subsurface metagenome]
MTEDKDRGGVACAYQPHTHIAILFFVCKVLIEELSLAMALALNLALALKAPCDKG